MVIRRLVFAIVLLVALASSAAAQDACQFGNADAAEGLARALTEAKSCKAAVVKLHECAWGSSADAGFSAIVVQKCEVEFYAKLSAPQKKNYAEQMQLCAYAESRQQGTMFISEAAMCQMDVAAEIAANHDVADKPVPRASFDCGKAESPLEVVTCSNGALGRADVVLGQNYSLLLKRAKGADRPRLVESESQWLQGVAGKCGLGDRGPVGAKTLNCLRNEFEIRFTVIGGCLVGGELDDCLNSEFENEIREESGRDLTSQRASFDCDAPRTGLEIAICTDAELGQKDIQLEFAYRKARTKVGPTELPALIASEKKWLKYVQGTCPLGAVGGIPPELGRACVRSAFEVRIGQLETCSGKLGGDRLRCLNDFKVLNGNSK